MGLRENLNKNPALAVAGMVVVVGLVGWLFFGRGGAGAGGGGASGEPQQFYTIDDGKTWFADSYHKLAPFEKDGKEAVVAHVYRDLDNKQDFVAYLSRVTPEGRKAAEERARRAARGEISSLESGVILMEYRRPGETTWIKANDPRAVALIGEVKSPRGSSNVEPVFPK
ncbi:MAG: hypothetical protein NZ561_06535 [Phycisphaerae bacterium]|nr:hypothetical protein [Phycisphaerae bacterium]MDW8261274.1 hypothetical protein [Phycisphaerales bacterium]